MTQATIDQIQSLRDSLSSADTGQLSVMTQNADGTVQRSALFAALRTMSNFAVQVTKNVFGNTSVRCFAVGPAPPHEARRDAKGGLQGEEGRPEGREESGEGGETEEPRGDGEAPREAGCSRDAKGGPGGDGEARGGGEGQIGKKKGAK